MRLTACQGVKLNAGNVVVGAGVINADESEAQVFYYLRRFR